jgi:hypothetical protein
LHGGAPEPIHTRIAVWSGTPVPSNTSVSSSF